MQWKKVKVKFSRYRPSMAKRVGRGIALLIHDRGTRRGWVVSSTPRPHFTPGKDPVQESGWAPGPAWTGGKFRPPGIRPQTVQLVVSRYTDWATRSTYILYVNLHCQKKKNIFRGIFAVFKNLSLIIYFTVSGGTPNDVRGTLIEKHWCSDATRHGLMALVHVAVEALQVFFSPSTVSSMALGNAHFSLQL